MRNLAKQQTLEEQENSTQIYRVEHIKTQKR